MSQEREASPSRHPIQVVARRTGLTPDVLRAWEKRYEAITPARSGGSRRLYSDQDIERLLLLRRAMRAGRSIGQVARMSNPDLLALVAADDAAAGIADAPPDRPAPVRADQSGAAARHLAACLAAVEDFDARALETAISHASVALSRASLMEQVLFPLMRQLGDGWREGTSRIAHEHLAAAAVRTATGLLMSSQRLPVSSPELVVATPAGQAHELGAIAVVATATSEGWRVTYLGRDLPAEEIAAVALHRKARAVALSIVHPADDARLHDELRRLRRHLPDGHTIIVGGASARCYQETLEAIGALTLDDMAQLRSTLEGLRLRM